jgi:hypothetical protein
MRITHPAAGCGLTRSTLEVLAMTAGMNTKPPIGRLRHQPRPKDAEDIPIGSRVLTPLGHEAMVIAYRGYKRGCRVWLVCRYTKPTNRRFDVVQVLPELVTVLVTGGM